MFALFYSLYEAMLTGEWNNYAIADIASHLRNSINALGEFLTSIFGDSTYNALGSQALLFNNYTYFHLIAFVLATITSIGIVVMAVKGVKKAFGIFFGQIR